MTVHLSMGFSTHCELKSLKLVVSLCVYSAAVSEWVKLQSMNPQVPSLSIAGAFVLLNSNQILKVDFVPKIKFFSVIFKVKHMLEFYILVSQNSLYVKLFLKVWRTLKFFLLDKINVLETETSKKGKENLKKKIQSILLMKYGPNVLCYLHLVPCQDFLDVRDRDIYVYIDDPSINMRLKWGLFMSD